MPVSGPGMNYYGGDRPGNNLFSNTTVALDAQTGKLKWYFQNIRHELWDYNLPPAPGLIDIRKDGKTIPALAQVGKSGFMFILNRENGTPIYGVDERPHGKGRRAGRVVSGDAADPEEARSARQSEHDAGTISSRPKTPRPNTRRHAGNCGTA